MYKLKNMTSEKNIIKLEKEIIVKMMNIKSGKITPKDSGIGKMINLMKSIDESLYDKIISDYKLIISSLN